MDLSFLDADFYKAPPQKPSPRRATQPVVLVRSFGDENIPTHAQHLSCDGVQPAVMAPGACTGLGELHDSNSDGCQSRILSLRGADVHSAPPRSFVSLPTGRQGAATTIAAPAAADQGVRYTRIVTEADDDLDATCARFMETRELLIAGTLPRSLAVGTEQWLRAACGDPDGEAARALCQLALVTEVLCAVFQSARPGDWFRRAASGSGGGSSGRRFLLRLLYPSSVGTPGAGGAVLGTYPRSAYLQFVGRIAVGGLGLFFDTPEGGSDAEADAALAGMLQGLAALDVAAEDVRWVNRWAPRRFADAEQVVLRAADIVREERRRAGGARFVLVRGVARARLRRAGRREMEAAGVRVFEQAYAPLREFLVYSELAAAREAKQ